MTRRLVTTRRRIPLDRLEEYLGAWAQLRDAVRALDGHAWLFRGENREDRFLEFIECDAARDISAEPPVAAASESLDEAFGQEESAMWTDAPQGAADD